MVRVRDIFRFMFLTPAGDQPASDPAAGDAEAAAQHGLIPSTLRFRPDPDPKSGEGLFRLGQTIYTESVQASLSQGRVHPALE